MSATPGTTQKHHFWSAAVMKENGLNRLGQFQTVINRRENTFAGLISHRIKTGGVAAVVFDGFTNLVAHSQRRRFRAFTDVWDVIFQ